MEMPNALYFIADEWDGRDPALAFALRAFADLNYQSSKIIEVNIKGAGPPNLWVSAIRHTDMMTVADVKRIDSSAFAIPGSVLHKGFVGRSCYSLDPDQYPGRLYVLPGAVLSTIWGPANGKDEPRSSEEEGTDELCVILMEDRAYFGTASYTYPA